MNTNIPHLLSAVRLCDLCRASKQPVWIAKSSLVSVYLIVASSSNFFSQLHWQNQQGTQKRVLYQHCVMLRDPVECLGFFSVRQDMEIHNKYTHQHYISNFINPSTTYISTSLYTTYISTSLYTRNKKD